MALYVGTNYHPHDWEPKRWETDLRLMKQAGFRVVRMGHLCWDSYEPEDGVYTFEWFDAVMELCAEEGLRVILDISMRPAPEWVHRICPGCEIYSAQGVREEPLRRYMEDVDDPEYQFYALRFAKTLVRRYKEHPALLGFGLCNEQGDGPVSYSEAAAGRFRKWLEQKYGSIERLNRAWNTQRWSRRLPSFAAVKLQQSGSAVGAPEAWLDMKRFYGEGVLRFLKRLRETVEKEAHGICHSSNHVAESERLGFDYLAGYGEFADYPGFGFYPGLEPEDENTLMYVLMYMQHRLAETGKPMWCLEFQTGNFGCYAARDGVIRMYALLCLAYRTQMVLAWTWRSMLGGEEQYYFGLLDHDGTCGKKYGEFAQIARDFQKLENCRLPYLPQPEAAVAYCYENVFICEYGACFYRRPYKQQIADTVRMFFRKNLDFNMVDLRNMKGHYRILVIPGHAEMTEEMADTVRSFVREGGIALMTAYSAKVDENNAVFDVPWPGRLSDVFGIRVRGFERSAGRMEENGRTAPPRKLCVSSREGERTVFEASYWEQLELDTAEVFAQYEEGAEGCAVSVHRFGKGSAYYASPEAETGFLEWLYDKIAVREGLDRGLAGPGGVVMRRLSEEELLVVNTTGQTQQIEIPGTHRRILTGQIVEETLELSPYDGDVLKKEPCGAAEGKEERL